MNPYGFQIFLCESALHKQGAALQQYADLTPLVTALQFDKHAQGGFGTMTCSIIAPLVYLEWLFDQALGLHFEVRDRFLNPVYEGLGYRVDLTVGNSHRSLALDQMYNHVAARYGSQNNRYLVTDADSIARFGKKHYVESLGTDEDATGAQKWATNFLSEHKSPIVPMPSAAGGRSDEVTLNLTAQGYWATLGWVYYRGREGKVDSATVIKRAIKSLEADHGYLALDYTQMPSGTGIVTRGRTRNAVTVQQRMIRLLNIGDSTGVRLMGGVGANRTMRIFARPTTADYFYDAWTDTFRDIGGMIVPKHLLEPGRFATNILNFHHARNVSDVKDDPFSVFLKSVKYSAEEDRVDFDPPDAISLLRRLARPARV